jgi:hypothetical protein
MEPVIRFTFVKSMTHLIKIVSKGFSCSCGHHSRDAASTHEAFRLAAQHQLAAFVRGVASGEPVTTTCLGCGNSLALPESNSEGLMHDYAAWIVQPCPSCGRAPREIVAGA